MRDQFNDRVRSIANALAMGARASDIAPALAKDVGEGMAYLLYVAAKIYLRDQKGG